MLEGRDRKKIFLTSKMLPEDDITREGFLKRARKCLEDLQTDYFDCMMLHMPERVEVLKTEGFHAAMEELKTEGRVRFVGVSHHGSFWFRNPDIHTVCCSAKTYAEAEQFLRQSGSRLLAHHQLTLA